MIERIDDVWSFDGGVIELQWDDDADEPAATTESEMKPYMAGLGMQAPQQAQLGALHNRLH